MKTKIKRHGRSILSVILALSMLVSCMMVGLIATDAARVTDSGTVGATLDDDSVGAGQYNKWWGGTIYFRVPDQWDLSTYPAVRLVVRDSQTGTTSAHNTTREMTVVGDASYSRLYKINLSSSAIAHRSLGRNEFIAFFACQSGYLDNDGSYALTNNGIGHYTEALDYGTNDKSYYMFRPSTETSCTTTTTNNPIEAEYKASEADAMKYNTGTHYAYAYTDGSSSATGGSTTINAYWLDGTTPQNSTNTNSPTASYGSMMEGCKVTVNATENTGYSFDGWYSDSALTTLVSSSAEYSYYSYNTKSLYASFVPDSSHSITAKLADSTISKWDDNTTANKTLSGAGAITLPIVKSVGDHKFTGWTVTSYGSGTQDTGTVISNPTKNDGTATVTTDCDDAVVTANFADSTIYFRYSSTPGNQSSFVDVPIDTTEDFTLRVTSTQLAFAYLFIDKSDSENYKYFKTNGSEAIPFETTDPYTPNTVSGKSFWARTDEYYSGKNMNPATGSDFSVNIPAGVYKIRYVAEYTENTGGNTLEYNFWKDSDITTEYYIAGAYSDGTDGFFGTAWSPNLPSNKMTFDSSTDNYSITYRTGISGGTVLFKVVVNGDWNEGSYPSANKSQVIYANSTYVTFTFNPTSHDITVTQDGSAGGGTSGWLYSKAAPAQRTVVDPIQNWTSFNSSTTGDNDHGKFRFMYGSSDTGLNTALVPSYYYDGSNSKGYWAELTDSIGNSNQFYFGLCNYSSKGNLVGNNSEEINDATPDDGTDVEIKDANNNTLFKLQRKQNIDVSGSAKYVVVYGIDWSKVAAIGVRAWDNSLSTNSSNSHNGKVDYQFYYKAKAAVPVVETTVVDIYAKDACLRDNTFNRFARLADTEIDQNYFEYSETNAETGDVTTYNNITSYNSAHSDKQIKYTTHTSAYGTGAGYVKMTNVPVGAKVRIKTTLSDNASATGSFDSKAFKNTHYLKAYSFNGMSYQVNTANDTGVYEEIWTVRAVNTQYTSDGALTNATKEGKAVEVTPIYYLKDNTNCKTFYIDGYDGTVQDAWGNLLCVYPYYEGLSNKDNAFGGYPGQPMLFWGGKYQMEVPLTVDGTATGKTVKGLTLHNSYWDLLHRELDLRCNARNHAQTYDYDDFYKLYKEKNPDTIIFDFKYRTTRDNYSDGFEYFNYKNFLSASSYNESTGVYSGVAAAAASTYAGSTYNGVELVTDYFGRQVDVFGNLLTDSQKSDYDTTKTQDKELLIVSTGYKDTYVGEYATLWAVYAPQTEQDGITNLTSPGEFIGLISSSELYLNKWDNTSKYPVSDHGLLMTDKRFEHTYTTLKENYTGVPALITYEEEIWNNSKDKANRSDGKWYYSNKADKISASIKIQYGSHTLLDAPDHSVSSSAWRDDPFNQTVTGVGGKYNIGTTTTCSAYFTNTTPNLMGEVASGEQFADSTKKFTFEAVASGSYRFAGWVRYSNGKYYEITENEIGESPMSANDVYIARFVDAQIGSLTVQHVVEQTDTYTGTGTPEVIVSVKNAEGTEVYNSGTKTDGSKIDISNYINSNFANYKIDISLATTPTNESYLKEIVSSSGNYASSPNTWDGTSSTTRQTATVAQFTVQSILDSGITSLRYVSHLSKPSYTYKYEITYHYTSRFWGAQSYTVEGAFTKVVDGNIVPDESAFAANTTGVKTNAQLNDGFIINKTPYEKNFRKTINWNYTYEKVGDANAMTNAKAVSDGENIYKMVAHVYSANSVNDQVMAEFILPYKYNYSSDSGYSAAGTDVYTATGGTKVEGISEVVFDESIEGSKRKTQAYNLFTYDDTIATGGDNIRPSTLKLVEAAPYVLKNVTNHTVTDYNVRYFSGSDKDYPDTVSFVVESNNTTTRYWLKYHEEGKYDFKKPDGATGEVLEATNVVQDDSGNNYTYAVKVDGVIYQFVNVGQDGVMYSVRTPYQKVDGVVQDTGTKKYFTRWDIYNSKGEFVASSYNRYFNYTGYDNYVVKAIYESQRENQFEYDSTKPISASITYLDDSRNQWNRNGVSGYQGGGNYATVTGQGALYAADKLFADFAITYNYNGKNINTVTSSEAEIKVGMVIERLDELDSVGTSKITNASHYADKYKDNESWKAIKTALEGDGKISDAVKDAEGGTGHSCYHQKIASNCGASGYGTLGGTPTENSPTALMGFDSAVDNFNRLQCFYTFNNTTQKTSDSNINTATMKNYAYRAISYIMVGDTAYLCDSPTYFTIYDTATRTSY